MGRGGVAGCGARAQHERHQKHERHEADARVIAPRHSGSPRERGSREAGGARRLACRGLVRDLHDGRRPGGGSCCFLREGLSLLQPLGGAAIGQRVGVERDEQATPPQWRCHRMGSTRVHGMCMACACAWHVHGMCMPRAEGRADAPRVQDLGNNSVEWVACKATAHHARASRARKRQCPDV